MAANRVAGTLRFYGTPAEEGGSGKVYMIRERLFADVDAVVSWHPGDRNIADAHSTLANVGAKFRFRGVSAHAAAAPERGRSALDGVEAMNNMVNLMREHVPSDTRRGVLRGPAQRHARARRDLRANRERGQGSGAGHFDHRRPRDHLRRVERAA
jgi:metal-dependent amidase/aminoacylase/carboxypeptidase family protein